MCPVTKVPSWVPIFDPQPHIARQNGGIEKRSGPNCLGGSFAPSCAPEHRPLASREHNQTEGDASFEFCHDLAPRPKPNSTTRHVFFGTCRMPALTGSEVPGVAPPTPSPLRLQLQRGPGALTIGGQARHQGPRRVELELKRGWLCQPPESQDNWR